MKLFDDQSVELSLNNIVRKIRLKESNGFEWQLNPIEIQCCLGLTPEEYYTQVYQGTIDDCPMISLSNATDVFSQESVNELVALLELLCGPKAMSALEKAGIFFSHERQIELMEEFFTTAIQAVKNHEFQRDTFSAMIDTFVEFSQATKTYIKHHFNLDDICNRVVTAYCSKNKFTIRGLAIKTASSLLNFLFLKHIIKSDTIFMCLDDDFLSTAKTKGYTTQSHSENYEPVNNISPHQNARQILGIESASISRKQLRIKYKNLIKHFHPDINPSGLRRCQEINAAYSILISVQS